MNQYICIYPFIELKQSVNIKGTDIYPGTEEFLKRLDIPSQDAILKFLNETKRLGVELKKFSYSSYPKDLNYTSIIDDAKKCSDFIRFRLSFSNELINYNQAIFVIIFIENEDSLKISYDGNPITVLNNKKFLNVLNDTKSIELKIDKKDLLPNSFTTYYGKIGLFLGDEDRLWRALEWYSKSFIEAPGLDDRFKVICLCVAFESLLNLPSEKISATFSSYVENFFSDHKELKDWASKFYDLRSKIVHGEVIRLNKKNSNDPEKGYSIYYKTIHSSKEFVKLLDIARPVFIDLVEGLSILNKKDKKYNYTKLFFPDESRLKEIKEILKEEDVGLLDELNVLFLGLKIGDLNEDGTGNKKDIIEISKLLLEYLKITFENTSIEMEILLLKNENVNNGEWNVFREIKSQLKNIKISNEFNSLIEPASNSNLPDEGDIKLSDHYDNVMDVCINWFNYVERELYKLRDSK